MSLRLFFYIFKRRSEINLRCKRNENAQFSKRKKTKQNGSNAKKNTHSLARSHNKQKNLRFAVCKLIYWNRIQASKDSKNNRAKKKAEAGASTASIHERKGIKLKMKWRKFPIRIILLFSLAVAIENAFKNSRWIEMLIKAEAYFHSLSIWCTLWEQCCDNYITI